LKNAGCRSNNNQLVSTYALIVNSKFGSMDILWLFSSLQYRTMYRPTSRWVGQ